MARPISSRANRGDGIWASYASLAAIGYVLYGVGAVGPYLRAQLQLTDTEVGLHSSALAVGLVVAGSFAGGLDRRVGEVSVRGVAVAAVTIGIVLLAAAPMVAATLAAALLIGLGAGATLGYTNANLTRRGGGHARIHVARGNVWAMVTAFLCPVVLSIAQRAGPGWWIGLLPALGLLAIVALDLRSGPRLERAKSTAGSGRLPRDYWLAWAFVAAAVAVEFSIVFWGATLVERRTGVITTDATLIGSLFLAGMFAGRLALSFGVGTGHAIRRPLAAGLVLAGVGAATVWFSTVPPMSAAGLFAAGVGVAVLYPLGVAAALSTAPGQPALAGTRLTVASGLAILLAPFALGAVADLAGVVIGWGIVVAFVALALAIVLTLARESQTTDVLADAPPPTI